MDAQTKRIADVSVRWMIKRDMPEVCEIENRSFDEPWSEKEFLCCLAQRANIGVVAESTRGAIYGFMIYELCAGGLVLRNFAVAPEVRRTGVGRAMVERLVDKLSEQRRRWITTEISEGNLPAQLFFSGCGFKATRSVAGLISFQYVLPVPSGSCPDWQGVNRITEYDKRPLE